MIVIVDCFEQLRAIRLHHDHSDYSDSSAPWHERLFKSDKRMNEKSSVLIQKHGEISWALHSRHLRWAPNDEVVCFNEWKRRVK